MTFFSILCALLIEQFRPLRANNWVYEGINTFSARMEKWLNAGQERHGRMAWILTMLALMVPTVLIYGLCDWMGSWFVLGWNVVIVYLTLGFRHYSHYFTSIQLALHAGDEATAKTLLAEWTKQDVVEVAGMDVNEVVRVTVEHALMTTHRHVFGVLFWFLMPLGPACAVMYRVAEHLAHVWNEPDHMKGESFGYFADRAFYWIDWIPVRLTAIAFAVVGNFEDAVYAWRNFSHRWKDEAMGIILSSGGGAMGVRLGAPSQAAVDVPVTEVLMNEMGAEYIESQLGELVTVRVLHSTVGLVWRALLLWMLLLLMLSIAVWLG